MAIRANIIIESTSWRPILIVVCRTTQDTSSQYATRFRQNLVAHGLDLDLPYFLLAFPTRLFLWRANANIEAPPDFTASTQAVLKPYMGRFADRPGGPCEESLEIALTVWLTIWLMVFRNPSPSPRLIRCWSPQDFSRKSKEVGSGRRSQHDRPGRIQLRHRVRATAV